MLLESHQSDFRGVTTFSSSSWAACAAACSSAGAEAIRCMYNQSSFQAWVKPVSHAYHASQLMGVPRMH